MKQNGQRISVTSGVAQYSSEVGALLYPYPTSPHWFAEAMDGCHAILEAAYHPVLIGFLQFLRALFEPP